MAPPKTKPKPQPSSLQFILNILKTPQALTSVVLPHATARPGPAGRAPPGSTVTVGLCNVDVSYYRKNYAWHILIRILSCKKLQTDLIK